MLLQSDLDPSRQSRKTNQCNSPPWEFYTIKAVLELTRERKSWQESDPDNEGEYIRSFQSLRYYMSSSYWEMRWQTVFDDMLQLGQHVNSLEDRHLETSIKCSPYSQMSVLKRCLACVLAFPFGFRAKIDRGARNGKPPLSPPFLLAPFFTRSVTLVPLSLLRNRTETLATQDKSCPSYGEWNKGSKERQGPTLGVRQFTDSLRSWRYCVGAWLQLISELCIHPDFQTWFDGYDSTCHDSTLITWRIASQYIWSLLSFCMVKK